MLSWRTTPHAKRHDHGAWGELWHVGGAKRERRNEILRARDTYDYGFVDWLYERTALTPDQEPEMFTPVPLDPGHLDTIV